MSLRRSTRLRDLASRLTTVRSHFQQTRKASFIVKELSSQEDKAT